MTCVFINVLFSSFYLKSFRSSDIRLLLRLSKQQRVAMKYKVVKLWWLLLLSLMSNSINNGSGSSNTSSSVFECRI